MNNKGFTLVELLAVMVILVAISLIAVGGISASLEKRDIKECQEQQELAVGAAKIYFSLNNSSEVTIGELVSKKYLGDKKIDRLNNSDKIKISSDKYLYNEKEIGVSCNLE